MPIAPLQREEMIMAKDERDIIELLEFELRSIEDGGYGRSVRTPWRPKTMFLDSFTCINYGDPERSLPCEDCHLIDFVPDEHKNADKPCHCIPLNEAGETIGSLEQYDNQEHMEEAVKAWLRATIKRLKEERGDA